MREYSSISPQFWIGETGKKLRGNVEAQLLAMYLMTSPHSNMIGVFHCPILYMAHETGMTFEGASKGLQSLIDLGFCAYEASSETVFVKRMAAYQVGEQLARADNRVKGIQKEVEKIASTEVKKWFYAEYEDAYYLAELAIVKQAKQEALTSPFEAPSKQLTGTGTGTGTDIRPDSDESDKPVSEKQKTEQPGFSEFWKAWPTTERKQGKAKCADIWKKSRLEPVAPAIVSHVEKMKASRDWQKNGGEFVPMPATYLNAKRWDGAEADMAEPEHKWAGAV